MTRFTVLIIALLLALPAIAQVQRTTLEITPDGVTPAVEQANGPTAAAPLPPQRGDYLIGQRSIAALIYNSCGIAPDGNYAGSENGSDAFPAVIENIGDDGTLGWAFEADRAAFTRVRRGGGLVENPGIQGVTVLGNGDGESWSWSHDLPGCSPADVAQTADGSVLVVGVNTDTSGELYCYDGMTGALLSSYTLPDGGWARVLDLSADGSLVASRGNMLHVVDTATGSPLLNQNAGASCDVVALSPDGHWLVAGWSSMEVYERVGDSYVFRWSNRPVPGGYANYARVNSAGDIVCGINPGNYNQTFVYMVNAADEDHTGVLYQSPEGDGEVQQVIRSIAFGDESNLAAIGNWGDANGLVPEVIVLEFGNIRPVATLDTRGSIYAVDGMVDGSGNFKVVACGKQTHANVFGNGGDYYVLSIPDDITATPDRTPDGAAAISLAGAAPNPFNPRTELHFTLDRSRHVQLGIYDLSGRRVALLADGVFAAGEQTVSWDGQDRAGRELPSGSYVIALEGAGFRQTSKLTLVR